jgi:cation diffusion facilitator family transporter
MAHDHDFAAERNRKTKTVSIVGAVTNLVLSVVKIVIGYMAHSQALIVDGIHSVSDLLSDALVLFAAHHANQEPDEEHPYGHGRFETAATMALGILLILVAIGIGWDTLQRMMTHEEIPIPGALALWATIFSILANEALYWYTIIVARQIHSSMLEANAWHHRSDAISSIVVLAGIGGTLLGIENLDLVAALIVAVMIGKIGWSLGWSAMEELVDKSLDPEEVEKVAKLIDDVDGVRSLHMLRTRKSGHQSAADVHVLVDPWLSVSEGHMIAAAVENRLKKKVRHLNDVTVHIDPENDEESPPCEGLPMRKQVMQLLQEYWQGQTCIDKDTKIKLHYLSGKINIDLVLPISCYGNQEQSKSIRKTLNEKIEQDKRFGRLQIFYAAE